LTADVDDDPTNNFDKIFITYDPGNLLLPQTGFSPAAGSLKFLPKAGEEVYKDLGDLWLEIPKLGVAMDIVGVPSGEGSWDVSWLWDDAGYLEDTTFPTHEGNSGLAGHTTLANGLPGPFAELDSLNWGDRVIVHGWGFSYVFEVREVLNVAPDDMSVLAEEEGYTWITLITCTDYDSLRSEYRERVVVRAVLLDVNVDIPRGYSGY
jgi:LPXTG-site transpeptidase (sortase) family protein